MIAEILKQSGRGQDFLNNPQMFIENAAEIIRDACYSLAIDGISYKKLYLSLIHIFPAAGSFLNDADKALRQQRDQLML